MTDRLDVGAVIRRVFDIYVDQYPVLLPASAVVFVISGIVSALLVAAAPGLALIALLLSLIANTLFTGMVVELVSDVQDGRRDHSAGELLRAATPVLGQLLLVAIVAAVGIVIGFVLIIVPGLILITIWSVAAPVVVLERPAGVFAALGRSRELVRGNGWQVFGVIFVLFFLVIIVSSAIQIAADSAGTGAGIVARVIVGILTGPISGLAAAVLYFDLRAASSERVAADGPVAPSPPPIS
jgi:ABC-type multidrug transport system fused ATPase/permease subunit